MLVYNIFRIFVGMRITKYNIDRFINGSEINCSNMIITHIEFIPEGITHLYCYNNILTELPKLPESLISLNCDNNQLTKLPRLPDSLTDLYCINNQLTKLPRLPDSLTDLYCDNNNIPYEITIDNIKEHNTLLKRKEILSKICV